MATPATYDAAVVIPPFEVLSKHFGLLDIEEETEPKIKPKSSSATCIYYWSLSEDRNLDRNFEYREIMYFTNFDSDGKTYYFVPSDNRRVIYKEFIDFCIEYNNSVSKRRTLGVPK